MSEVVGVRFFAAEIAHDGNAKEDRSYGISKRRVKTMRWELIKIIGALWSSLMEVIAICGESALGTRASLVWFP
jgi:hypothetical protein